MSHSDGRGPWHPNQGPRVGQNAGWGSEGVSLALRRKAAAVSFVEDLNLEAVFLKPCKQVLASVVARLKCKPACHHYESLECATAARQHKVAEVACYRLERRLMGCTPISVLKFTKKRSGWGELSLAWFQLWVWVWIWAAILFVILKNMMGGDQRNCVRQHTMDSRV